MNVKKGQSCQSVIIEDRRGVLILFSPLKDLSAEQLVTGKVHMMVISTWMLGYIGVTRRRVEERVVGKLALPFSRNCFCHFSYQQCSSLSTQSGDGKSSSYILASCMHVVVYSSAGRDTRTEGTIERPNNAVC